MTKEELHNLIDNVIASRAEFQNIELKAAKKGCPESALPQIVRTTQKRPIW